MSPIDDARVVTTIPRKLPLKNSFNAMVSLVALMLGGATASAQTPTAMPEGAPKMIVDIEKVKVAMQGEWLSIAPEIRPSATKTPDGTLKPFYLTRVFKYLPADRFELAITNFADAYGTTPLARIVIHGHMFWRGAHPIAPGAQKVDFVADEGYEVTPLLQGFADVLNRVAGAGYNTWEINVSQSVFGKSFLPFGLQAGTNFSEFDLVYLRNDMLFWGARNIDGRGFDSEANRPTNLQIPMVRR
jgi:hypothetical protein